MNKKDGFSIYEFMVRDLGLSKNGLLIYALIYNETVSNGAYYGSSEEIAKATGMSKHTAKNVIRDLAEAKYIERICISGSMRAYKALLPEYTTIN